MANKFGGFFDENAFLDFRNQNEATYFITTASEPQKIYIYYVNCESGEILWSDIQLDDIEFVEYAEFVERDLLNTLGDVESFILSPYKAMDEKANAHDLRIVGSLDGGKTLIFAPYMRDENDDVVAIFSFFAVAVHDFSKILSSSKIFWDIDGAERIENARLVRFDGDKIVM